MVTMLLLGASSEEIGLQAELYNFVYSRSFTFASAFTTILTIMFSYFTLINFHVANCFYLSQVLLLRSTNLAIENTCVNKISH